MEGRRSSAQPRVCFSPKGACMEGHGSLRQYESCTNIKGSLLSMASHQQFTPQSIAILSKFSRGWLSNTPLAPASTVYTLVRTTFYLHQKRSTTMGDPVPFYQASTISTSFWHLLTNQARICSANRPWNQTRPSVRLSFSSRMSGWKADRSYCMLAITSLNLVL
jgi:hypothetical protein